MPSDLPFTDPDDADRVLWPVWENAPDETDANRRRRGASDAAADADLLLATLADAADALARLDARLPASDDAVRSGLCARLSLTEAAGWLAHAQAWVHPLDLALREAGLTAPAALAALGAGSRALPHTIAQPAGRLDWADPPLDTMPAANQAIADALVLARLLRRLPGGTRIHSAAPLQLHTLASLGTAVDRDALASWRDAHAPATPARYGARRGEGRASSRRCSRHRGGAGLDGGCDQRPSRTSTRAAARVAGQGVAREVTGRERFRAFSV